MMGIWFQVSQALTYLDPRDSSSVAELLKSFTPKSEDARHIALIRGFRLGSLTLLQRDMILWLARSIVLLSKMDAIGPELKAVEFSMFSPQEIRKLAVVEVS